MANIDFRDNPEHRNVLELNDVGQSYDNGKTWIIRNFEMLIEKRENQGRFVGIMGMSGSGKSTILRYIAGLQTPTEGTVLLNDKPVGKKNRSSMVFQQYSSLPWMSVVENVALALRYKGVSRKERTEQAMDMIDAVGLSGHEHKYAQYPTLSGGQLQRVAIARSLLANSDILLMDEPFGALDVKTRLQMQDLLTNIWLKYHPTIVFVTHDISEAVYLCEDIYILKSQPSRIVRHLSIELGIERNRTLKRDPLYTEYIHEVEDTMMDVSTIDRKSVV